MTQHRLAKSRNEVERGVLATGREWICDVVAFRRAPELERGWIVRSEPEGGLHLLRRDKEPLTVVDAADEGPIDRGDARRRRWSGHGRTVGAIERPTGRRDPDHRDEDGDPHRTCRDALVPSLAMASAFEPFERVRGEVEMFTDPFEQFACLVHVRSPT